MRVALGTVCLALLPGALTGQGTVPPDLTAEDLEQFVVPLIEKEMTRAHVPGVAFALVRDGVPLLVRGFGHADLDSGRPVGATTVFRVGSVSKTITALAALQLVEQGRLTLDADVNDRLEMFRVPATWPEPVTLFHLLTHTAGFGERYIGQHAPSPAAWQPLGPFLRDHLPRRRLAPGLVISYNDYGTSLAGHLVECATGQTFADYTSEHVFRPLGMSRSTFAQAAQPEPVRADLARSYRFTGSGHEPCSVDYVNTTPAAGLFTCAADMSRLIRALLGGGAVDGARILAPESVARMFARQFAHHGQLPGRAFGLVESRAHGRRGLSKDGRCSGFLARLYLVPEASVGWFSVHNLSILEAGGGFNTAASFHRKLTSALLDRYFPNRPADRVGRPEPRATPARDLQRFLGTYRDVTDPRESLDAAFLNSEAVVSENGAGGLLLGGSGPWLECGAGLFQYHAGGPNWLAFSAEDAGPARFLFMGSGAFERLAFYETQAFRWTVLAACGLVFLAVSLSWPVRRVVRRRRRARAPVTETLADVVAAAYLLAALGVAGLARMADPELLLFHDAGVALRALLGLAWLAAGLSALLLGVALVGVVRSGGARRKPLLATAVSMTGIIAAAFLWRSGALFV